MILENWIILSVDTDPFAAPETRTTSLHGEVFGHPGFREGQTITTSAIVGKTAKDEIRTRSGSVYTLGQVRTEYEEKYPDAKAKLLSSIWNNE